jgi:hypothetical protein
MIVTPRLQEHFDSNREVSRDTLNYLLSLWINPQFAEQCEAMFNDIRANIREVVAVMPKIKKENIKIVELEWRATGKVIKLVGEAANDRAYGWLKKVA